VRAAGTGLGFGGSSSTSLESLLDVSASLDEDDEALSSLDLATAGGSLTALLNGPSGRLGDGAPFFGVEPTAGATTGAFVVSVFCFLAGGTFSFSDRVRLRFSLYVNFSRIISPVLWLMMMA
jgi:hypothetical protein